MSFDNKKGAFLSAATLSSIIKYPHCYNGTSKKIGYFLSEREIVSDLENFGVYQKDLRNPFAFLLEAADDLAYLISDLEDGLHKKIIWFDDFKNEMVSSSDYQVKKFYNKIVERINPKNNYDGFEKIIKPLLFQFRENIIASIEQSNPFEDIIKENVNEKDIFEDSPYYNLFECLKRIKKKILNCNLIRNLENFGDKCIKNILESILPSLLSADESELSSLCKGKTYYKKYPFELIPENLYLNYKSETLLTGDLNEIYYLRCRLLIDYVSGMTDNYAKKINKYLERKKNKK